ncbi:MAG: peptidyl-tRNA hydrolase [Candidatus Aenigmarchaeota archaeon]|nr:peptidyl-tRNA hydrolase [Candidatus Aenigmarchaeota archaeon]
MKQVILVRTDIKMSVGKKIAQACHASIGAAMEADENVLSSWNMAGSKKIALKVSGENLIRDLYHKARRMRLPCFLVADAGLTQLDAGTITALAIGPAADEKIDKITGDIKLL